MSVNDLEIRVGAALGKEEPVRALRAAVRSLLEEGHSRRELVEVLEDYREHHSVPEAQDERILDVMAVLDGWANETAVRNLLPPPCVAPHAQRLD